MSAYHAGSLILLNGASSSGKSVIIKAFREIHPEFSGFKIDDYFPADMARRARELGWHEGSGDPWSYLREYAERIAGKPCFDTEVRSLLFDGVSSMFVEARKAVAVGKRVIIDTVFEYDPEYEKFSEYFKEFKCFKVLVYCPIAVLKQRVQERNVSGIAGEARTLFQSFEQFPALYTVQNGQENNSENSRKSDGNRDCIDAYTSVELVSELKVAIQELIESGISERYYARLREFERMFSAAFKLHERDEIRLVARHQYDLILNSGFATPEALAQEINGTWQARELVDF